MSENNNFFSANWQSIFKPTVVMLCICIIVTLALSGTNLLTADRISEMTENTQKEAMSLVMPADGYSPVTVKSDGKEYTAHKAEKDNELLGYIFVINEKGYGGDVSVMTAVKTDGTVAAVKVLDASNETPGLGQNTAKESFYSQYAGHKNGISVVKNSPNEANNEIEAVTGATISSKAVTRAVNKALDLFGKLGNNSKGGGK